MLYVDSPVLEDALHLVYDGSNAISPHVIGKGSYGLVLKSIYKQELVAVKIIDIDDENKKLSVEREANAVNLLHPNILHIKKISQIKQRVIIIMDTFEESESLQHLIEHTTIRTIHCLRILLDIILGLKYCHEHDIVHMDIKPLNVLVCLVKNSSDVDYYVCKICDFGSSIRNTQSENVQCALQWSKGTVRYMSPSALQGRSATTADDIYSFGITMWQLLTRKTPYDLLACNDLVAYNVVSQDMRPDSSKLQQQIASGTLDINVKPNLDLVTNLIMISPKPPLLPLSHIQTPTNSRSINSRTGKKKSKPAPLCLLNQSQPLLEAGSRKPRLLYALLEEVVLRNNPDGNEAVLLQELYSKCWHKDSETRPGADEIANDLSVMLCNY